MATAASKRAFILASAFARNGCGSAALYDAALLSAHESAAASAASSSGFENPASSACSCNTRRNHVRARLRSVSDMTATGYVSRIVTVREVIETAEPDVILTVLKLRSAPEVPHSPSATSSAPVPVARIRK